MLILLSKVTLIPSVVITDLLQAHQTSFAVVLCNKI